MWGLRSLRAGAPGPIPLVGSSPTPTSLMESLRSLFASPLRVRLMLPTAVAREFPGLDDDVEIRSQLMLSMLAFLRKAFRRPLPLLQHESGRSAEIGEVEEAKPGFAHSPIPATATRQASPYLSERRGLRREPSVHIDRPCVAILSLHNIDGVLGIG